MRKQFSNTALAAGFALALAFTFSCSSDDSGGGGHTGVIHGTSVPYGNETYETVVIGNQTWMARNLNYVVDDSRCYGEGKLSNDEIQANCAKYGRLYTWSAAMALPSDCNQKSCDSLISVKHQGICPLGWHIPSDGEWTTLTDFIGDKAGTKLKATSGWNDYEGNSGNGTDDYGFFGLPGGIGYSDGSFDRVGFGGIWWGASENYADIASIRCMFYSSKDVHWFNEGKTILFSVRCVQD